MNGMERAKTYAAIFLNVGERWRFYVPLDATVSGDEVFLQGVRMRAVGDTWEITENGTTWRYRKAEASDADADGARAQP